MKFATIVLLIITSFATAQADLKDQIIAKEREELTAVKAGDYKTFADLIADDALFLDPHGPGRKSEVVEHVSDFELHEFTMEDIHFIPLSASSGIVVYKLTQKGSSHGHEFTTTVFASATWVERNGKWVCVFSQETPARKQ